MKINELLGLIIIDLIGIDKSFITSTFSGLFKEDAMIVLNCIAKNKYNGV